ncbi:hypothetical protein [Leekyejoonella antrihumi]|uniref:Uridine kinase n=1 Tax=Leekyejoonella antrihumi TaxID=1660198 RepID=A0A563DXZ7_9MICO|nr:hypothetical protein [Leekyejoonella antrihumi]TWP34823.1 hypothetical protein FGL98_15820 [Leekyejoonella antrihumi]
MRPVPLDEAVALIVRAARSASVGQPRTVIVGIDGRSGAGKTTTADLVATCLGSAQVVHMDDFYTGWHGLAQSVPRLAQDVLAPVCRGEHAGYRRYDWVTQAYAESIRVLPGRFLVVEGCGSTTGPARICTDVRVWLDAPPAVRRRRGLARDGDAYRPMWSMWRDQEDDLFRRDHTRDHAHLSFSTG